MARRDFNEAGVVDILHRFRPHEVRELIRGDEVPREFRGGGAAATADSASVDVDWITPEAPEALPDKAATRGSHGAVVSYDPLADLLDASTEDTVDDIDDL
jgi:hypothetical protein